MAATAQPKTIGRPSYVRLKDPEMLRAIIDLRQHTLEEMARLVGCHRSMIGFLVMGRKGKGTRTVSTCSPELAVRIEKALKVKPGLLFEPKGLVEGRAA